MGEIIEVRLSDQQHRQLMDEARAAGQKFFDYCRAKLTSIGTEQHYGTAPSVKALPGMRADSERMSTELQDINDRFNRAFLGNAGVTSPADDRIGRIEDAVARLTDYVMGSQQPAEPQPEQPIDVDSIVNAQFHEAEAAGLTEHVPDENEEVMRHAGVRPLSRRPMRYSANSAPRHLQQL